MVLEKYIVWDRETCGNRVYRECDTMKEARDTVGQLETADVRNGTFEPYTYEIKGLTEVEGDCEGQAVCWPALVDIEEGGVMP